MKIEILAIKGTAQIPLTIIEAESIDLALDEAQTQLTMNYFWGVYCIKAKADVRKLSLIGRPVVDTVLTKHQIN